jgi:hypothetical protein
VGRLFGVIDTTTKTTIIDIDGRESLLSTNIFDSAAWYLLSYSNTLSFSEWRDTVKQVYAELEKSYGTSSAADILSKMVAYYCMESCPGKSGRAAASAFRKSHKWEDFRNANDWWCDEWLKRRKFDQTVVSIRKACSELPSLPVELIHEDHYGRRCLDIIMAEAVKRSNFGSRYSKDNLVMIESLARVMISIYGGEAVFFLLSKPLIKDWNKIPSLQTMYFLERELVAAYGDSLIRMKQRENDSLGTVRKQEPQDNGKKAPGDIR